METKAQLRKRMKAIRDGISPELRKSKNEQIVKALLRENWYADAKIICVYAAIASEVALRDFCQRAWKDGKKLYFPKAAGWFVWILSILIGLSRLYVGVHYPTDVLGGAIVAIVDAVMVFTVYKKCFQKIGSGSK